jgi:hypothetical protein
MLAIYLHNAVVALDRLLNAWFWPDKDAPDTTLSLHAARDQAAGKRGGCVVCAILAAIVQRRHCERTLAGETTGTLAGLRAAMAMAALVGALHWAFVALVEGVF